MLFKKFAVAVFFFFSSFLFAQNIQNSLISVRLDKESVKHKIAKLDFNIFHQFDNALLTIVNNIQLSKLDNYKIDYTIIDNVTGEDHYYLTSTKKESDEIADHFKSLSVYNYSGNYLLKNIDPNLVQNDKIQLTELFSTPNIYNDIKTISNFTSSANLDSIIVNLTEDVNRDSITYFIQSLQNFGTRYLYAENRKEVATWIMNEFLRFGIKEVELDSFVYANTWQYNVVATIPSSGNSDQVIVIGGHHDSISGGTSFTSAPGADDNASGTTAVLELARVLMLNNYKPETTIKFMTFAAEERGLHGSYYYADKARRSGEKIKLMINHDMISYSPYNISNSTVDINYYEGSDDYSNIAYNSVNSFTNLNVNYGSRNSSGSDSYAFWQNGYNAVYFEEHDFTPYYHTPSDLLSNNNMAFCTEVIKASCATMITSMILPARITNINIVDIGDGSSLLVEWDESYEDDLSNYNIYVGEYSGNYYRTEEATTNSIILDNLEDGKRYYIAVTAEDVEGFESYIVEHYFVPHLFPRFPKNVVANALFQSLKLTWDANLELDLLGYNVFRSQNPNNDYIKLNNEILFETEFIDESPVNGEYNYYVVTAVDSLLNESEKSIYVKGMPVTLDNGILVVDETTDGNGALMSPTDAEVDEFYSNTLGRFSKRELNVSDAGGVSINDLGAYSTIIWHYDDNKGSSVLSNISDDIKTFLNAGGNLIFVGYNPSKVFDGNSTHPNQYYNGEFVHDYLKIEKVNKAFGSKFIGGISTGTDYPDLFVDTTKTKASSNYHLSNIEALYPTDEAGVIYTFDSRYDESEYQGAFKGEPVGIEYLGDDYKLVVLSFPLYYMKEASVEHFLSEVLAEKFGEKVVVSTKDEIIVPAEFSLSQNFPNPFNPSTIIKYSLPETMIVNLTVYNMLGQQITELINEVQNAGSYKVEFNSITLNKQLASGAYIYRLKAGDNNAVMKMLLIK